jgi:hypothetical protein
VAVRPTLRKEAASSAALSRKGFRADVERTDALGLKPND